MMSVNRIGNSSKKKNNKARKDLVLVLNNMEDNSIFIYNYHGIWFKGSDNMKSGGFCL